MGIFYVVGLNKMEINLNPKIYPLEAILNTCYNFIDHTYIFLDSNLQGDQIRVSLKGKKKISKKKLEALKGEFMNELLHSSLRYLVSKNNKKIREYIIGRALYSALSTSELSPSEKLDYQEDPLGIAIPWEEKYGRRASKEKEIKSKEI